MGCGHAAGYTLRMISALLWTFVALALPGLFVLVASARRAPVGYEDASGFHAVDAEMLPDAGLVASAAAN